MVVLLLGVWMSLNTAVTIVLLVLTAFVCRLRWTKESDRVRFFPSIFLIIYSHLPLTYILVTGENTTPKRRSICNVGSKPPDLRDGAYVCLLSFAQFIA